jgi:anaerobic magnesium-protoporphyrin IX monomethyl ester cyclase
VEKVDDCVLINYSGKLDCFDRLVPDLGIAYIAGSLERAGYNCRFFDLNLFNISIEDILSFVTKEDPLFVGFKVWETGLSEIENIIHEIKRKSPHIPIICGGPLPKLFESSVLHVIPDLFDFLVYSEGEEAVVGLAEYMEGKRSLRSVPNIMYIEDGEVIENSYSLIENLDELPLPAWDVIDLGSYLPLFPINMKRGCAWSCPFCAHPSCWGRRVRNSELEGKDINEIQKTNYVRLRSWKNIEKEIERNYFEFNVRLFDIVDSTPHIPYLKKLADHIIINELDIKWNSFARVEFFTANDFLRLKDGGCTVLWYGIESGNDDIRREEGKYLQSEEVKRKIKMVEKSGIHAVCSYIVGYPGESRESVHDTSELIKELSPDSYSISPFLLQPGTPIAFKPEDYDIELGPNWREKVIFGLLESKNELENHYYNINGISNTTRWKVFEPISGYRGWYDDRVAANMEIVYLLSEHMSMKPNEFLYMINDIIGRKDVSKLRDFIAKAWNFSYTICKERDNGVEIIL